MRRLNKLEIISKRQFVQAKFSEGFMKRYSGPGAAVTTSQEKQLICLLF